MTKPVSDQSLLERGGIAKKNRNSERTIGKGCMKLDYLHDDTDECPMIRLYNFDNDENGRLCDAILLLKSREQDCVLVHELPWVESIEECRLTLRSTSKNKDMSRLPGPASFELGLTSYKWGIMALMVREVKKSNEYQWLWESGDAKLLFSKTGQW